METSYKKIKEDELSEASAMIDKIKLSDDSRLCYRDVRAITDIRHMIESSAEMYGERTAFYVKDSNGAPYRPITYNKMKADVDALGTALTAKGLKGKRIAVIGENCYQWAISYLAVVCGVGVVVPLDKELRLHEIEQLIIESETECVLFTKKYRDMFIKIRDNGNTNLRMLVDLSGGRTGDVTGGGASDVTGGRTGDMTGGRTGDMTGDMTGDGTGGRSGDVTGGVAGGVTGGRTGDMTGDGTGGRIGDDVLLLSDCLDEGVRLISAGNRDYLNAEIVNTELCALLFTSGTTGIAKGVMLSHKNLVSGIVLPPTVVSITKEDIFFSILPIHHCYECTCGFLIPLYRGAAIAYCEGLKYIVKNLSEIRPTVLLAVPLILESLYRRIWQTAKKSGKANMLRRVLKTNTVTKKWGINLAPVFFKPILATFGGRMKIVICGGAAIDPAILQGIRDFGITALQGYGLTECSPICALNPDTSIKNNSAGYLIPGLDGKIENPDDMGIGEICVKGDHVMMGYYNNQNATEDVITDGWFHTGDIGYIDEDRYVFITGRKKNVIITKNGKNVFPEELEYYLGQDETISECMVWGVEGDVTGETLIVATIRPDEDALKEQLGGAYTDKQIEEFLWDRVDKINENLALFKRIRKIIVRKEEFEMTTGKKIKRFVEANKSGI
ncbi:MAG: AMP-binding protein [Clostridiales Family XIII bacterium]|nr:AMP-binding protein [Clostridiales Family XIII bacterium]